MFPSTSTSTSFSSPPLDTLSTLPNEILLSIYTQLQPKDRLSLRKVSKRFQSFVDSEGLLPYESVALSVDYQQQVLFLEGLDGSLVYIVNSYHSLAAKMLSSGDRKSGKSKEHYFCRDVGESWESFVEKYLRKLQIHMGKKTLNRLEICLPGHYIPQYLQNLHVKTQQLEINQLGNRGAFIPEEVYPLIRATSSLHSDLIVPASLISPLSLLDVTCTVQIEDAVRMIEAFEQKTLPDIFLWKLRVEGDVIEFFEKLSTTIAETVSIVRVLRLENKVYGVNVYIGEELDVEITTECPNDKCCMHPWLRINIY